MSYVRSLREPGAHGCDLIKYTAVILQRVEGNENVEVESLFTEVGCCSCSVYNNVVMC